MALKEREVRIKVRGRDSFITNSPMPYSRALRLAVSMVRIRFGLDIDPEIKEYKTLTRISHGDYEIDISKI